MVTINNKKNKTQKSKQAWGSEEESANYSISCVMKVVRNKPY